MDKNQNTHTNTPSVLVSIVMPAYNAESTIRQAIDSVLQQTFTNWELIVVDDCSKDNTANIVAEYASVDHRILYYRTDHPSGSPTQPRNIAMQRASGRYIAFLDSDDAWAPSKLEHQLPLMQWGDAAIVFSYYKKMEQNGTIHSETIVSPQRVDYKKLLEGNYIGCLTAMYDTAKVGKMYFHQAGHEDYILWLAILKKGFCAYNTESVEAYYRVNTASVSSNKRKAIRWQWNILRHVEQLSLLPTCYYFMHYAVKGLIKFQK